MSINPILDQQGALKRIRKQSKLWSLIESDLVMAGGDEEEILFSEDVILAIYDECDLERPQAGPFGYSRTIPLVKALLDESWRSVHVTKETDFEGFRLIGKAGPRKIYVGAPEYFTKTQWDTFQTFRADGMTAEQATFAVENI